MTKLSLYTHCGKPLTSYLNHRYPGGTLNFYPTLLSNFSRFSVPIERSILTSVQKVVTFKSWTRENVQNFNDSCSQNVLIEMKYS